MAPKLLTIDISNSEISFKVKKLGILTISGSIADFSGEVSLTKENSSDANFNVCVCPPTVNTGNARRDEHLKSKDFFFVNKYPEICFKSTAIISANNGYEAIGNLTILGFI